MPTTIATVAKAILANPPSSLTERSRTRLEKVGEGGDKSETLWLTFERDADCQCDLTVSIDTGEHIDPTTDANGDEWQSFRICVTINWSLYGSVSPSIAMSRANFYTLVSQYGFALEMAFPRLDVKVSTAEERAAWVRHQDEWKLREILEERTKGMRVDGRVFVTAGIAPCTYTIEIGKKRYAVEPRGLEDFCVTRTV